MTLYGCPFAQVPEWVLDAEVSDRAVRLFGVLHRYADADGRAYPGRPKLAARLRCGVSSLDRALDELVAIGAVLVEAAFRADGSRASNNYWLWPAHPPVGTPLPTGEQAPPPPVGRPLPTQRAASSTDSQLPIARGTDSQHPPQAPMPGVVPTFDDFYAAYPLHTGKEAARKAWATAVRKADPAAIVAGAARYAADPNRDPSYTAHPSTWLNAGRWDDEPLPPRAQQRNGRAAARPIDTDRTAPGGVLHL